MQDYLNIINTCLQTCTIPAENVLSYTRNVPAQFRPFRVEEASQGPSATSTSLKIKQVNVAKARKRNFKTRFNNIILPLVTFSVANECVDDDLRAVEEIAELRLPYNQPIGMLNAVAILKA